jgi:type VI secretion system secreted protein VgrG
MDMKTKYLILSAFVLLAGFLPAANAQGNLNSAGSFAVLGGSTVTSTGDTVLTGNLGVSPGTSITGFYPAGIVNGTIYASDGVASTAHADAVAAYGIFANEAASQDLTGQDLAALTLTPGVYSFGSGAQLTGLLTLSGTGEFVFQIGSTLTTASGSSMVLINGAQAGNVFWQVGSSATLGTSSSFAGSILAAASITLNTGASVVGRALAMTGAVTLDSNIITVPTDVPEPNASWLFIFPVSVLGIRQWLAARRRQAGGC